MPAEKTHRRQRKLAAQNKSVRSVTRSRVATARVAITTDAKSDAAADAVKQAISALDRAASKGVIHPNNAARRKSRLLHGLNKAKTAASA
jgi:small subunit ribosomal protein S20